MACACMRHWSGLLLAGLQPVAVNYRVLILEGIGRVSGSTAITLSKLTPVLRITVAAHNSEVVVASDYYGLIHSGSSLLRSLWANAFWFFAFKISFMFKQNVLTKPPNVITDSEIMPALLHSFSSEYVRTTTTTDRPTTLTGNPTTTTTGLTDHNSPVALVV
ncbi:hypothetical protein E3N88_18784 [Mikania micrantha]|uniref:Secreted protein n=1 Tax=Mikania micrantha TaxID=192012 RepID=A0A5N6NP33_9ASTR|nr:hypothetical protein E3N88_18784 [Mikania micrantha]